eukprot:5449936-Pyramimonas_sp.AAC.1
MALQGPRSLTAHPSYPCRGYTLGSLPLRPACRGSHWPALQGGLAARRPGSANFGVQGPCALI